MIRHTLLIAFLFFTTLSFGQKINQRDSSLVMSQVKFVFELFKNPDFVKFEKLSTKNIYCIICFSKPDFTDPPYLLKRKDFFDHHLKEVGQSDVFSRATKSSDIILIKENDQRSGITVFFTIYKKDELAPGHEGGQLGMYFKKENNIYKFAGIETVP